MTPGRELKPAEGVHGHRVGPDPMDVAESDSGAAPA
jgi:hypothetical protein